MCSVKRALALSTLLLRATIPWVNGEGAETAQGSSALDREKAAFESRGSLAPTATSQVEQTKAPEVLIVLEKEFGIRARWEDLAEESVAKRLSEILGAISQLRSAKKGEFETTAEFQARRAGLVGNPILDTKQILLLPQSANSTYDADSELLRVDLPLMLFWGPSDDERPNGTAVRAFAGDFPKDYFGDAISLVDLKIPRDQARQLKPNLKLLLLARLPSPEAPAEDWATESGKSLRLIPTAILAFSAADGAVVHRQALRAPAELRIWSAGATLQDWLESSNSTQGELVSRLFRNGNPPTAIELRLALASALELKQLKPTDPIDALISVPALPKPSFPVPLRQTRPKYPAAMLRAGISGEVVVGFTVREDGSVGDLRIVRSSQKEFENAAKACVAQWRWKPAMLEGKAMAITLQIPIAFTLNDQ
jgi:TonB family protein